MTLQPSTSPAELFNTKFFPQHVTLVTVADNMIPMGYWTVISKGVRFSFGGNVILPP